MLARLQERAAAAAAANQPRPLWTLETSTLRVPGPIADFLRESNERLGRDYDKFQVARDFSYLGHFTESQKSILEAAKGLTGTVLILGIGGAHDIPIAELAEQFAEVVVVDIDLALMDRAIRKVPEQFRSRIHVHQADVGGHLSGILDKALEIAETSPKEQFLPKLIQAFQSMKRQEWSFPQGQASFVVSSMVISQLSHTINEGLAGLYIDVYNENMPMSLEFADFMKAIEMPHIDDLKRWTTEGGRVYFSRESSSYAPQFNQNVPLYAAPDTIAKAQAVFKKHVKKTWEWGSSTNRFNFSIVAMHLENESPAS